MWNCAGMLFQSFLWEQNKYKMTTFTIVYIKRLSHTQKNNGPTEKWVKTNVFKIT